MKEKKGLNVGDAAPDFTSKDIMTGQSFNLQGTVKKHRGMLINFIRNEA